MTPYMVFPILASHENTHFFNAHGLSGNYMSTTYVIGHVNPDTDSIASAMGYSWFLKEQNGEDVVPARAGALNSQTLWILKRLNLETPVLITDASPRFQAVTRHLDTTLLDRPLYEAWAIAKRTGGIAPIVDENGIPVGIITGLSLFNYLAKPVGPHSHQQELRISQLLDVACSEACDVTVPRFPSNSRIRDFLNRILREEHNDFLVVDEKGQYVGVCRQRDVLNPPRLRLILVDHNEASQALNSLDEAELIEIIDHHRLGNHSTHIPIRFTVDVVGSTTTLISERIEDSGLSAPSALAGLMLAGLLSDTLLLSSPTTTDRDRRAAERLSRWTFVRNSPLAGENINSFGHQIMEAATGLTRDPAEIIKSDMKHYEAGGMKFAIAQVEVTDHALTDDLSRNLFEALKDLRDRHGLDFAMLMITDVVKTTSKLFLTDMPPLLDDLPYPRLSDGSLRADGVVSRKKQLLPLVLGLLER